MAAAKDPGVQVEGDVKPDKGHSAPAGQGLHAASPASGTKVPALQLTHATLPVPVA